LHPGKKLAYALICKKAPRGTLPGGPGPLNAAVYARFKGRISFIYYNYFVVFASYGALKEKRDFWWNN